LARAAETASIIAAALALSEAQPLRSLREQHQGAWTGLTRSEVKKRWPDRYRERPRQPVGGETTADVLHRTWASLVFLHREYPGRCLLVVTHTGVIREVERWLGCRASPIPYLQGRWVELADSDHPAAPKVIAREPTAGRHVSAVGLAVPLAGGSA
jgi:broad specificity phosphatase PhoE